MKLKRTKKLDLKSLVLTYKNKKDFKGITVKWAIGENNKYCLSNFKDYKFFAVDPKILIEKVDFGDMGFQAINPRVLFGNSMISDFRVAKILNHWEKGGYIDPPTLSLNLNSKKLYFANGRHRTISAFHLDERSIPVAVHESLITMVNSKIPLN